MDRRSRMALTCSSMAPTIRNSSSSHRRGRCRPERPRQALHQACRRMRCTGRPCRHLRRTTIQGIRPPRPSTTTRHRITLEGALCRQMVVHLVSRCHRGCPTHNIHRLGTDIRRRTHGILTTLTTTPLPRTHSTRSTRRCTTHTHRRSTCPHTRSSTTPAPQTAATRRRAPPERRRLGRCRRRTHRTHRRRTTSLPTRRLKHPLVPARRGPRLRLLLAVKPPATTPETRHSTRSTMPHRRLCLRRTESHRRGGTQTRWRPARGRASTPAVTPCAAIWMDWAAAAALRRRLCACLAPSARTRARLSTRLLRRRPTHALAAGCIGTRTCMRGL